VRGGRGSPASAVVGGRAIEVPDRREVKLMQAVRPGVRKGTGSSPVAPRGHSAALLGCVDLLDRSQAPPRHNQPVSLLESFLRGLHGLDVGLGTRHSHRRHGSRRQQLHVQSQHPVGILNLRHTADEHCELVSLHGGAAHRAVVTQ